MDTLPRPHAIDTRIFIMVDTPGTDGREYARGEQAFVKILPYTSTATLTPDRAAEDVVTLVGRQGLPWVPGNLLVNGTPFAAATAAVDQIALSWAHRNRKVIQTSLIGHIDGSVGGLEPDASYRIRVYNGVQAATPVRVVSGITETQWTYDAAMAAADAIGPTPCSNSKPSAATWCHSSGIASCVVQFHTAADRREGGRCLERRQFPVRQQRIHADAVLYRDAGQR